MWGQPVACRRPPGANAAPPLSARQLESEADRSACGVRAVYLFGRFSGFDWDYRELRAGAPEPAPSGTSFEEIRRLLVGRGVGCEIRRVCPADLPGLRTPLIVYMRPEYMTAAAEGGVDLIDPITGQSSRWGWSGHCLCRVNHRGWSDWPLLAAVLANACVLVVYLVVCGGRQP